MARCATVIDLLGFMRCVILFNVNSTIFVESIHSRFLWLGVSGQVSRQRRGRGGAVKLQLVLNASSSDVSIQMRSIKSAVKEQASWLMFASIQLECAKTAGAASPPPAVTGRLRSNHGNWLLASHLPTPPSSIFSLSSVYRWRSDKP
jgi:hypothetical protein